ncbi:MAG TPA: hypothetical protein VJP80_05460 [Candidatus Saccharimonadales bacterium]|nr:hypothetical protein [Candidatus Saccharimonadales bacterium]
MFWKRRGPEKPQEVVPPTLDQIARLSVVTGAIFDAISVNQGDVRFPGLQTSYDAETGAATLRRQHSKAYWTEWDIARDALGVVTLTTCARGMAADIDAGTVPGVYDSVRTFRLAFDTTELSEVNRGIIDAPVGDHDVGAPNLTASQVENYACVFEGLAREAGIPVNQVNNDGETFYRSLNADR